MEMKPRYQILLLALLLSLFCIESYAQIDMDKQLRERKEKKDDYDDSDRDRLNSLFSFYLTPRTGDLQSASVDTMMLNYHSRAFIEGLSVAEAYAGTYASPYQSKIYFDRPINRWGQFFFTQPYGHLFRNKQRMQWYDTKTPYTFLKYLTVGNNENKEQNFTFTFSSNLGKEWSLGGDIDIDYANGYYAQTSSKNFTYRVFSYYRGDRYQAYASMGNTNATNQESGGITDMRYVTNPDDFMDGRRTLLPKDIPTRYKSTWNRMVYGSGRFHHKYRFGYYQDKEGNRLDKEVEEMKSELPLPEEPTQLPPTETESSLPTDSLMPAPLELPVDTLTTTPAPQEPVRRRLGKSSGQAEVPTEDEEEEEEAEKANREFVPVAAIFHDFQLEKGRREWVSLDPAFEKEYPNPVIPRPAGARYFPNDSFSTLYISNTVGVEVLEGFKKWAKMGIAAFVAHDYRKYSQPLMNWADAQRLEIDEVEKNEATENSLSVGGRISSNSFKYFDYYAWGQVALIGAQAGEVEVSGQLNTHIPLLGHTVTVSANVDFQNIQPSYYLRKFKASLHEWDRSLKMIQLLRVGGSMNIPFTKSRIFANFETLQNPIAPDVKGIPVQTELNTRVISVGLDQSLSWKILNWENSVIWQSSSHHDITPLPMVSVYSNFYLKFLIAKVMTLQVGADAKWHTAYYAPYYEPSTQQFRPQEDIKIGGEAPLLNAYVNAHLKRARFFVKYYNVGALLFKPSHFTMPNYPLYPPVLRMGVAVDLRN